MAAGNKRWLIGGATIGIKMSLKNDKSLGQHWLKDREILNLIADYAATSTANLCLEIGPGLGTLTSSLLKLFPKVLAVEFDQRLAENLPKSFPGKNLEVINADFLKFELEKISEPYVVAGNIPYYITSPIIMKLLETKNRPERIVLLIQKEVAERITAEPGDHTVISLSVQNLAKVSLGLVVGREFFTPPPKVDSQIIILEPKPAEVSAETIKLIRQGFSAPRKKLIKNLGREKTVLEPIFKELNLSLDVRPSTLTLEDWQKLENSLAKINHKR